MLAIIAGAIFLPNHEPICNGKTVSQWLKIATDPVSAESEKAEATNALRQLDTNAIPILLKKLETNDRYWRLVAGGWNYVIKHLTTRRWYYTHSANESREFDNHEQALLGFRLLGSRGEAAIPQLKAMLADHKLTDDVSESFALIHTPGALRALATGFTNSDAYVRYYSLTRSASFFDARELTPYVETIIAMRNDPDEDVATVAVAMIDALVPQERAVPLLLERLKNGKGKVQTRALYGLYDGPDYAMEPVAQFLSNSNAETRRVATNVLISINIYRAPEFGVNTNDVSERYYRIQAERKAREQTNSFRQ